MKYVLNEDGSIKVGPKGQPLVLGDDNKEFEIDAIGAQETIANLHIESKGHRTQAAEYKKVVDIVGDLDITKAKEALVTINSISDKHKLDVDKIRSETNKAWQVKYDTRDGEAKVLEGQVFDLKVTSQFATSEVLKTTILTPDIAATFFGKHFGKDGAAKDSAGNTIYSKERPGEIANFDEALTVLIDNYPGKASILKGTGAGGSGSGGAGDGGEAHAKADYYDPNSKHFSVTEQGKVAKLDPALHTRLKTEAPVKAIQK